MKEVRHIDLRETAQPSSDSAGTREFLRHLNNNRILTQKLLSGEVADCRFSILPPECKTATNDNQLYYQEILADLEITGISHHLDEGKGVVAEFCRPAVRNTVTDNRAVFIKQRPSDDYGSFAGPPELVAAWGYHGEELPPEVQQLLGLAAESIPSL